MGELNKTDNGSPDQELELWEGQGMGPSTLGPVG